MTTNDKYVLPLQFNKLQKMVFDDSTIKTIINDENEIVPLEMIKFDKNCPINP
jgi:hypothetical protein